MSVRILIGDCRERLRELGDASVDSVVCDPPYHLTSIVKRFGSPTAAPAKVGKTGAYARASKGFMGQTWDGGDVAFQPETWAEVLRVLKPGGHLIAFSGTRTYHRMVCAIEDAGFEVRDQLAWVYGSGFPKSHSVALAVDKLNGFGPRGKAFNMKGRGSRAEELDANGREFLATYEAKTEAAQQWQGWGTALKPSWEPICLARKPLVGTVAQNVLTHGTGALNIDGCRIAVTDADARDVGRSINLNVRGSKDWGMNRHRAKVVQSVVPAEGRWPANLCWGCPEDEYLLKPTATAEQRRELYGWLSENA